MAIPRDVVGTTTAALTVQVDRGRLQLFAKAVGETDRIYWDVDAAVAAGHPDVPVPPTYLFALELERDGSLTWLTDLGVAVGQVLHGTQSFRYSAPAHAGDALTVQSEITDVYKKNGGLLELIERRTTVTRGSCLIATLDQTVIVRHAQAAA